VVSESLVADMATKSAINTTCQANLERKTLSNAN